MTERERLWRLHVVNRLQELRAKYGTADEVESDTEYRAWQDRGWTEVRDEPAPHPALAQPAPPSVPSVPGPNERELRRLRERQISDELDV